MAVLLPALIDVELDWATAWCNTPDHVMRPATVPSYILWLVTCGEMRLVAPGYTATVPGGMLSITPPDMPRQVTADLGTKWYSLAFRPTSPVTISVLQQMTSPHVWTPMAEEREEFEKLLVMLTREFTREDPTTVAVRDGLLRALIGLCWRRLGPESFLEATETMPPWLAHSLQVMHDTPQVSVLQLAEQVGYSVAQFRHLFSQAVGMPPHRYLQRRQIQLAQTLLASTDLPIGEIAERVGFHTPSHFTRLFKRLAGILPHHYRHHQREAVQRM